MQVEAVGSDLRGMRGKYDYRLFIYSMMQAPAAFCSQRKAHTPARQEVVCKA